MAENSEDKTPSNLETQSWLHRSYHRFRHVIWKYVMKFSKIFLVGVFETLSWIRRGYDRFRHTARKFSRNLSLIIRRFFSSSILMAIIVGILVLLLVGFVSVMFSKTVEEYIGTLLGLTERKQKNEILTFLGIGMGGVLVALQALMSYRRAKAMEGTVQNTENGLRQERLKNAIEHLGNNQNSVRLGGAYELFHLAQDNPEMRPTVFEMFCAYIRRTTSEDEYRKNHHSEPSEEVQSLLTLLFVQDHDVFRGLPINLQKSFLDGANLTGAYLEMAILSKAQLNGADLREARLHGVNFWKAQLNGANLGKANLRGIDLREACLHGANLGGVRLHGAKLSNAGLRGACLMEAQLQGARLMWAQLQGASLIGAQLQGAYLLDAQLQGTESQKGFHTYYSIYKFADRIIASVGQESKLSGAAFEGGLRWEDVHSIVKDLSDIKTEDSEVIAKYLPERLAQHIGKPASHELPEQSGANTGAYTFEEAKEWITEYEKVTAHIPTAME